MQYMYQRYKMYILGIYNVYTKDKPCSICNEYSWYITGISEPDQYMHGIYIVHT